MKRTIAFLLTLVMLLGMIPGMALAAETTFTDVEPGAYYENAVQWAVEKGITTGLTETSFGPDSPCTRGQVVTFLWRAVGKPVPTQTVHSFTDVTPGAYYYDAMLWAVEAGVTTGMSATTFCPDAPCTRGQVVTFLWRAMNKPEPTRTNHSFADVTVGGYYYNAMLWAVEENITTGTSATTFEPDTTCNRAQVVTFLFRALKEQNPTEPVEELKFTQQPKDVKLQVNEKATFTVKAEGGMPELVYQWEFKLDGTDYKAFTKDNNAWASGWNTNELTVQVDADDFAKHFTVRCVVTDARNVKITSNAATVTEHIPLQIATAPASAAYGNVGEDVKLQVVVSGGVAPYAFEWYYTVPGFDGRQDVTKYAYKDCASVTSSGAVSTMTLTVPETLADAGEIFYCRITDADGQYIDTDGSKVLKLQPFKITKQIEDVSVDGTTYSGGIYPAYFYIGVVGGLEPYTYKWEYCDPMISNDPWKEFDSENAVENSINTANLVALFTPEQLRFSPTYPFAHMGMNVRCTVTDANGQALTSVVRLACFAPLMLTDVSENPEYSGNYTDSYSWTVEAVGGFYDAFDLDADYAYQWQEWNETADDWVDIPGDNFMYSGTHTNTLTYKFTNYDGAEPAIFRCRITDSLGDSVYSDNWWESTVIMP